jgi:hypothetical protein
VSKLDDLTGGDAHLETPQGRLAEAAVQAISEHPDFDQEHCRMILMVAANDTEAGVRLVGYPNPGAAMNDICSVMAGLTEALGIPFAMGATDIDGMREMLEAQGEVLQTNDALTEALNEVTAPKDPRVPSWAEHMKR